MYYVEITTGSNTQLLHDPYASQLNHTGGAAGATRNTQTNVLTEGKITKVLNAVGDFTFALAPNHPLFLSEDYLKPYMTLVKVYDEAQRVVFRGRILNKGKKMLQTGELGQEIVAEDELAFLIDSKQRHGEYHNISPKDYFTMIINNHNDQLAGDDIDKSFVVGECDITDPNDSIYRYLAYKSSFENIKEDLLNSLGGYLSITYDDGYVRYINYLQSSGVTSTMSFDLAENLISIDNQQKMDGVITRLIPLGAEYDSVPYAIQRLADAQVMTNPDFWLENYSATPWLDQLIINMGDFNYGASNSIADVEAAIVFLEAAGVLSSADYWRDKANTVNNLSYLLIQAAQMIDTAAGRLTIANASKPRLTVASVNNGRDYIDIEEVIGDYNSISRIEGAVTWSDITQASNLLSAAKTWIAAQTVPDSVTITAYDLSSFGENYERFEVGNTYTANNELLGISQSYVLTQQVIDIVNPTDSTFTFGDRQLTINDVTGALG